MNDKKHDPIWKAYFGWDGRCHVVCLEVRSRTASGIILKERHEAFRFKVKLRHDAGFATKEQALAGLLSNLEEEHVAAIENVEAIATQILQVTNLLDNARKKSKP